MHHAADRGGGELFASSPERQHARAKGKVKALQVFRRDPSRRHTTRKSGGVEAISNRRDHWSVRKRQWPHTYNAHQTPSQRQLGMSIAPASLASRQVKTLTEGKDLERLPATNRPHHAAFSRRRPQSGLIAKDRFQRRRKVDIRRRSSGFEYDREPERLYRADQVQDGELAYILGNRSASRPADIVCLRGEHVERQEAGANAIRLCNIPIGNHRPHYRGLKLRPGRANRRFAGTYAPDRRRDGDYASSSCSARRAAPCPHVRCIGTSGGGGRTPPHEHHESAKAGRSALVRRRAAQSRISIDRVDHPQCVRTNCAAMDSPGGSRPRQEDARRNSPHPSSSWQAATRGRRRK